MNVEHSPCCVQRLVAPYKYTPQNDRRQTHVPPDARGGITTSPTPAALPCHPPSDPLPVLTLNGSSAAIHPLCQFAVWDSWGFSLGRQRRSRLPPSHAPAVVDSPSLLCPSVPGNSGWRSSVLSVSVVRCTLSSVQHRLSLAVAVAALAPSRCFMLCTLVAGGRPPSLSPVRLLPHSIYTQGKAPRHELTAFFWPNTGQ